MSRTIEQNGFGFYRAAVPASQETPTKSNERHDPFKGYNAVMEALKKEFEGKK